MYRITHDSPARITVGVDTHKDFHVAWAKDQLGGDLGHLTVPAGSAGYRDLLSWAEALGTVEAVGIEGPGSYGAGLARFLTSSGHVVLEVGRPNRQHRARHGKSDPADARAAAAAVLAGEALGIPKAADGTVESIRMLSSTRSSAVKAKVAAGVAMQDLLVNAPEDLRRDLGGQSPRKLVRACAVLEPPVRPLTPSDAALIALVRLARRYEQLETEAKELELQIHSLVGDVCPELLGLVGIGPEVAATMLVACGDNPARLGSESSFAKLCGVSPVDASSGRQIRHRLNRGGNRRANRALHTVVVVRLRMHAPTRAYMARRLAEGKTKKEVMRCLKRYVVREVFTTIRDRSTVPLVASSAA